MLGFEPPYGDPIPAPPPSAAPPPGHRPAIFATQAEAAQEAVRRGGDEWTPVRLGTGDWALISPDGGKSSGAELPALDAEAAAERYGAVIRRIARDRRVSKRGAHRRFAEMLRFLDVCATSEQTVSPPPRVDHAWHEFIVFTRDYAAYCEERFGFFIHHDPTESKDVEAYERAYHEAALRFGALDRRIWPPPRSAGGGGPFGLGGGGDGGGWFGEGGFLGGDGGGCGGGGCGGGS